jgi:hypothetical protein
MNSLAPFPFTNPIADLAREGRASDAMQQWMRALQASIGTEYRNYTPTSSGVPGFTVQLAQYRLYAGNCELNLAFLFNGDGVFTEIGVSLPVPSLDNFGQFNCLLNATPGGSLVNGNAYVNADGFIHITLNTGVPFANAQIYTQLSGRYRVSA